MKDFSHLVALLCFVQIVFSQCRKAFVTSTMHNGRWSTLAAADMVRVLLCKIVPLLAFVKRVFLNEFLHKKECANLATTVTGLSGTFVAWLRYVRRHAPPACVAENFPPISNNFF
jgi:hypothetical protein